MSYSSDGMTDLHTEDPVSWYHR